MFEREGIALRLGASLISASRIDGGRQVTIQRDGIEETINADEILVAVGRAPNVEGLDLEAAGIAATRGGVTVDDFLRTSNPRVYAAGDICTPYKFTHAADAMARIAIQNALVLRPQARLVARDSLGHLHRPRDRTRRDECR